MWTSLPLFLVLFSEDLLGAGIGWMKVDSNGRATPAEHQVQTSDKRKIFYFGSIVNNS